jgi:Ca-activated chloride channel family protein
MRQAVYKQIKSLTPPRIHIGVRDRILLGIISYFVLALVLRVAIAQPVDDIGQGTLLMETGNGEWVEAPRLDTRISARVTGLMAEVEVQQRFRNDSGVWIEATYAYPLPDDAAINRLVMTIGERQIQGEIKEKQQAIRTYQAARAAGQTASLVTQQRPNLFTTKAANIAPGEEIDITIHYVQQLDYRDGRFNLRFPITITPRFDGQAEGANAGLQPGEVDPDMTRHVRRATGYGDPAVAIQIHLQPGFDLVRLESRYHDIDIAESNGLYLVELADGQVPANRDFELVWEPSLKTTPQAALFTQDMGEERFALLMVMPPLQDQPLEQPRELILIIDTSGSMQGDSIIQARESLRMAIGSLKPGDRFNVIQFNSNAEALFPQPVRADAGALVTADNWVSMLQANGGTNMAPALNLAFAGHAPDNFVRQVVFITDGSVGNEVELFAQIERQLGDTRLFTVGIGSAPNAYFMRKSAQFGRGSFTLISDVNAVAEKMDGLLSRLEYPVLTDLCVDWPVLAETYPRELPDLYLGEPLVVSARLDAIKGEVEVCGQTPTGSWNKWLKLNTGELGTGVSALWARRKISSLMDDLALGGDADLIRDEVLDVALDHQLVSRYTAFVAVDLTPERSQQAELERVRLTNLAPAGSHVGGLPMALPQTATDAQLRMVFGCALLLLAGIFTVRLRDEQV